MQRLSHASMYWGRIKLKKRVKEVWGRFFVVKISLYSARGSGWTSLLPPTNNPDFHKMTMPTPPTLCPQKREGTETINWKEGSGGSCLCGGDGWLWVIFSIYMYSIPPPSSLGNPVYLILSHWSSKFLFCDISGNIFSANPCVDTLQPPPLLF